MGWFPCAAALLGSPNAQGKPAQHLLLPFYRWGELEAQVVKGWTEVAQAEDVEASFPLSHLPVQPTLCPASLGLFLVCLCVCVSV